MLRCNMEPTSGRKPFRNPAYSASCGSAARCGKAPAGRRSAREFAARGRPEQLGRGVCQGRGGRVTTAWRQARWRFATAAAHSRARWPVIAETLAPKTRTPRKGAACGKRIGMDARAQPRAPMRISRGNGSRRCRFRARRFRSATAGPA
ncbi:hypothetical protein [Lysobacter gummosus]|uniref:hypothetical protein n=1 Tax=Lysobacter gummosus TaxID=262324 RepID=UPI003638C737